MSSLVDLIVTIIIVSVILCFARLIVESIITIWGLFV